MRKSLIIAITITFIIFSNLSVFGVETDKRAQTGLKFLEVSLDARASSMGGALTSLEGNSVSMFYNPAGMSRTDDYINITLGQLNFIANIDYIFGSAAINIDDGKYGVFGVNFVSVDYGKFFGTIRADNEQGFLETGNFSPSAYAVGVGYAKALTDKFSVGGNARYVYQNLTGGYINFLEDESAVSRIFDTDVISFDFGILYKTGFKSLNFGMNLRNFSKEIKYITESFQLPLTFEIGLSINAVDLIDMDSEKHQILVSVDAVHPRDYPEKINFGVEYAFMDMFAIRSGINSPSDEEGISFGVGFNQEITDVRFHFDYGYTSFGVFDDVHRFTIQFGY
jgi:hypothetical protein